MIILGIVLYSIAFLFFLNFLTAKRASKLLLSFRELIPNSKKGNLLYQQTLSLNSNQLNKSKQLELIQYKFFTALISELIQSARKFGTSIHCYLPDIKKGLIKDIQMDKKIFTLFLGGVYQFLLIFILGFVFVGIMMKQLDKSIDLFDLIIPVSMQIIGLLSFSTLYIYLRKTRFNDLFLYLFKLYQIRTLAQAQMPLKKVFKKVSPDHLSAKGDLKFFKEKVFLIFSEMRNSGEVDTRDLDIYINELWQYIDLQFEKFNKELAALKLLHLALFSLGGYLVLLLQIFSTFSL